MPEERLEAEGRGGAGLNGQNGFAGQNAGAILGAEATAGSTASTEAISTRVRSSAVRRLRMALKASIWRM